MPPDSEITLGEVFRQVVKLERGMQDKFSRIEDRLDQQFVNRETYMVQMGALIDRVEALEEAKRWTARTFVAAFLFPVAVAVMVALVVAK